MKRIFSAIAAMMSMAVLFTACAAPSSSMASAVQSSEAAQEKQLNVVTTIFPIYDWARNVIGEDAEHVDLQLLVDNGVDLHSYQATTQDIIMISDCDLFIYVGGESDSWVHDVLEHATNPDMKVLNLIDLLGDDAKLEEMVEGMQESEHNHDHDDHDDCDEDYAHDESCDVDHDHDDDCDVDHDHDDDCDVDHEHDEDCDDDHDHEDEDHDHDDDDCDVDHDHDDDCDDDHDHEAEHDEHVWLSLENARVLCDAITQALVTLDAENGDVYTGNNRAYQAQLDALDGQYETVVDSAKRDTLLFADRFPFRYLVDDYDLDYYAAFVGCSAETEASFETVAFLANKVNELDLGTVLVIEGSDQKLAKTVIASTTAKDQEILVLDSMQATNADDIANGETYLSAMQNNLTVLEQALN